MARGSGRRDRVRRSCEEATYAYLKCLVARRAPKTIRYETQRTKY